MKSKKNQIKTNKELNLFKTKVVHSCAPGTCKCIDSPSTSTCACQEEAKKLEDK